MRSSAAILTFRSAIMFLNLTRTPHSIDHTGKFDQQPITGHFDDAAPVFGDLRVD
jgi:hypothetical protein